MFSAYGTPIVGWPGLPSYSPLEIDDGRSCRLGAKGCTLILGAVIVVLVAVFAGTWLTGYLPFLSSPLQSSSSLSADSTTGTPNPRSGSNAPPYSTSAAPSSTGVHTSSSVTLHTSAPGQTIITSLPTATSNPVVLTSAPLPPPTPTSTPLSPPAPTSVPLPPPTSTPASPPTSSYTPPSPGCPSPSHTVITPFLTPTNRSQVLAQDGVYHNHTGNHSLIGGIRPAIIAQSTALCRAPLNQTLHFVITLFVKNERAFIERTNSINTRGHKDWHNYIKPGEFHELYHYNASEQAALEAALAAEGVFTESVVGTRMRVNATVSSINTFFHTNMSTYLGPDNTTFIASPYDLQVPPQFGIFRVENMDTIQRDPPRGLAQPNGPFQGVYYLPTENYYWMRVMYDIPFDLDGTGQSVGVVGNNIDQSDVDWFEANEMTGSNVSVPIACVPVSGGTCTVYTGSSSFYLEIISDVGCIIGMAPHLDQVVIYSCQDFGADCYQQAALDGIVSSMSQSVGSLADPDSNNQALQIAMAHGLTITSASGDNGCDHLPTPTDQPLLLSVGGVEKQCGWNNATTRAIISIEGYPGEQTWKYYGSGSGGGGGVSPTWPMSSWQVPAATQYDNNCVQYMATYGGTCTAVGTSNRAYPDVAAYCASAGDCGPFLTVTEPTPDAYSYSPDSPSGTSLSAPVFAGFIALVNQKLAQQYDLPPIGFVNPVMYEIFDSNSYTDAFHDITDLGFDSGSCGVYFSMEGWDPNTGLGSINSGLLDALIAFSSNSSSTC